jgi:hypothetical protein
MKNIKTFVGASVLGIAICGFAIAQSHRGEIQHHYGDSASALEHLSEAFAKFASFDVNKDAQLDAAERESIAKAIADGTLQIPAHTPPKGVKPDAEALLSHIASVYAWLASKDANHDGALDATEQTAIKKAIEKGELAGLHGKHPHAGGGHHE